MNDLFKPSTADAATPIEIQEVDAIPYATDAEMREVLGGAFLTPIEKAKRDDEEFDWSAANPDLVIRTQPATAVYINPFGQAVIRQENVSDGPDGDPFVYFTPENLLALIDKLIDMLPPSDRANYNR